MTLLETIKRELRTAVTRPQDQLSRGQRTIRFAIDLARHARHELRDHSASTMAAALTYRTIFGLVPLLVMALIVFRAFGGFASTQEGITNLVYDLLEIQVETAQTLRNLPDPDPPTNHPPSPPELDGQNTPDLPIPDETPLQEQPSELDLTAPEPEQPTDETLVTDPAAERDAANAELKQRIDTFLNQIAGQASTISVGSIGVVGTIILIWAALGLIVTVEKTFNVIYNAPAGRPWHIRIPIYWAVITLGPVLIWASFYLSTQLVEMSRDLPVIGWLLGLANRFMALLVTWLLVLLLFKLMPNAKVAIRPAMIGAMVSALAWEGLKAGLRWYIDHAVVSQTQSALYGSLALIPLLLFWVYLTWLVILAGLEVTHILQTLPANRVGSFTPSHSHGNHDPWLVIPVMSAITHAFNQGKTLSPDEIAEQLNTPVSAITHMVDALTRKGLLHQLEQESGQYALALALPPDKIRINDLVDTSHPAITDRTPGYALLNQIAKAQEEALRDATLEDTSR